MQKLHILFITFAVFCLIGCNTECVTKQRKPSDSAAAAYSFTNIRFFATEGMLYADTDATDDTEFIVSVNNRTVSAKSLQGKLSFCVEGCWTAASKGGKTYPARVFVSGDAKIKGSADFSLDYWPVAELTLHCPEEMIIYNGSTKTFEPPSFSVNYESKDYDFKMSFKVTDKDGSTDITDSVGTEGWKLSNMLEFLEDATNDGRSVRVIADVTPKRDGEPLIVLGCTRSVIYHCRKDILVTGVELEKYHDYYVALTYDADHNRAGGDIVYDWQVADTENAADDKWVSVNELPKNAHKIGKNDVGKYMRCVIVQTFEGHEKDQIVSNVVHVQNTFAEVDLWCSTTVQEGHYPSIDMIRGTAVNIFGEWVEDLSFRWTLFGLTLEGMSSSNEILVTVSKSQYDSYNTAVLIPVQGIIKEENVTPLSTDVWNITRGKVKFSGDNGLVEVSFDNGKSWGDITTNEFDAQVGDKILVRKRESGTPFRKGWLIASEPIEVTVAENNIGTKTDVSGITVDVGSVKLELTQTAADGLVQIVGTVNSYEIPDEDFNLVMDYKWLIDGIAPDKTTFAVVNQNVLTLRQSELAEGETYQVSLRVHGYYEITFTQEPIIRDVFTVSDQISVKR